MFNFRIFNSLKIPIRLFVLFCFLEIEPGSSDRVRIGNKTITKENLEKISITTITIISTIIITITITPTINPTITLTFTITTTITTINTIITVNKLDD